jgi:hypothetical protein
MMVPLLLLQICLLVILIRMIYVLIHLFRRVDKPWFEILFYIAVIIVVYDYYTRYFHRLL